MPQRIGIDLIAVADVDRSLERQSTRYLERIFTEREVDDCRTRGGLSSSGLATRFAAKEATLKVLRPEDEAIPWCAIEVVRHPEGSLGLELVGRAAAKAAEAKIASLALSLSCEAGLASAIVVADCVPEPR